MNYYAPQINLWYLQTFLPFFPIIYLKPDQKKKTLSEEDKSICDGEITISKMA